MNNNRSAMSNIDLIRTSVYIIGPGHALQDCSAHWEVRAYLRIASSGPFDMGRPSLLVVRDGRVLPRRLSKDTD
jgi:hypothetical protein